MKSDSPRFRERVDPTGLVQLQARRNGRLVHSVETSNLVTTRGLVVMARVLSDAGTPVTHIATGSDNTAPSLSDTTLGTEAYRDQVTQYQRSGAGAVTFKLYIGAASANGTTIKEAGLFNDASAGEMVARVAFSTSEEIVKTSDITVQISWTITFT